MKKNIIQKMVISFGILCMLFMIKNNVFAYNNENNVMYEPQKIPAEFDSNISFQMIEEEIQNYIEINNLNIQIGTEEYLDLMYSILYGEVDNITQNTERYFAAYASMYVVNVQENDTDNMLNLESINESTSDLNCTISDMQKKNQEFKNLLNTKNNEYKSKSAKASGRYNISKAQEYAKTYAKTWNYVYGKYSSDCTNFASQIVHNAGMPMVAGEWQWNGNSIAKRTWNVAHTFTEYWSITRGYNGGGYTNRSDTNKNANPGDFIAYMNVDTYEIWHVAFVQSKSSDGAIYITQHTTDRYNERWNSIPINHTSDYIIIKFS